MAASNGKIVSSPANPLLKDVRRSVSKGSLTSRGFWVAENFHLLREALQSNLEVSTIITSTKVQEMVGQKIRNFKRVPLIVISELLFKKCTGTESAQGVISLVRPPTWELQDTLRPTPLVVVLDGLQDPGNVGSIVRSAEAFGATGVIFLDGTASPFNPKTLRASAGSLFRIPFVVGAKGDTIRTFFRREKIKRIAATPYASKRLSHHDCNGPTALIIGSEARGIRHTLLKGAEELRISTTGVESLNAATAAAIILYEAARQRTQIR